MLTNNDQIERRLVRIERAVTLGFSLLNEKIRESIPKEKREVFAKEVVKIFEEISFDVKAFYEDDQRDQKKTGKVL
jgi:hypothetical protein